MKLRYIIFSTIMLPFLEFAFFGAISERIGLLPAFILLLGVSFYGFYLLKSQGRLLIKALKAGDSLNFTAENARKGLSTAVAALLFAFPGFLSDIVGALILVFYGAIPLPKVRVKRTNDGIIDLTPDEWKETSNEKVEEVKKPRKRRIKSDLKPE
jgi:UPF0716 family protein affecting phage T7 exclusion